MKRLKDRMSAKISRICDNPAKDRTFIETTIYLFIVAFRCIGKALTCVAICVELCWFPFSDTDFWGVSKKHKREEATRQENRRRYLGSVAPKPLTEPRQHSLTLPLPEISLARSMTCNFQTRSEEVQQTNSQRGCILLSRIPFEIRRLIYYYAVGGSRLHIADAWRRFGFVRCRRSDLHATLPCYRPLGPERDWTLDISSHARGHMNEPGLLSLLKTCRIIYSEARDVMYRDNTFLFSSTAMFRDFSTTIRSAHLNTIQSISFCSHVVLFRDNDRGTLDIPHHTDKNSQTWMILSQMKSLRWLYVRFIAQRRIPTFRSPLFLLNEKPLLGPEKLLLGPLKQVRQCETFEVEVDWPSRESDTSEDFGSSRGNSAAVDDTEAVPYILKRMVRDSNEGIDYLDSEHNDS